MFKIFLKILHQALLTGFLFISILSFSQSSEPGITFLSKDSLPNELIEDWKYFAGDSSEMSGKNYNDSRWRLVKSSLNYSFMNRPKFNGIAWLRYHLRIDSTLIKRPMALGVKHLGASEIYLDGQLIVRYGSIGDSAKCTYYDPQELPQVFTINDTGEHVIAVRYANYNARRNHFFYNNSFAGFEMLLGTAEMLIEHKDYRSTYSSLVLVFLIGIFIILCFLHLLLFIYHPTDKSNIYFSLFMFCLAYFTVVVYITIMSNDVTFRLNMNYGINYLMGIGCLSISLFVNELFVKKRGWRFRIIVSLSILVVLFTLSGINLGNLLAFLLLITVSIEAISIIIGAIYKKIKGARIIGFGILFFSLFFLTIFFLLVITKGNFDINDSTIEGRIILLFAAMAIISVPLSMSVYLAWRFANMNKNLQNQLNQIKTLSEKNLEQEQEKVRLISGQNEMLEQKVEERTAELKLEKKKSDDLLLNILPSEIAEELKQKGKSDAQLYDHVSVLFTDFVSFTSISEKLSPKELVDEINHYFTAFDAIMERNGLEKIKTIGDAYMAVCGMPNNDHEHAIKTVRAGLEILDFIKQHKSEGGAFDIRIGINSGAVVAGIVGVKKFAYDIWGDTVNTAARMEQNSEPGKINISGSTYAMIKDHFTCLHRGKINAKNKGDIDMYFVGPAIY